MNSAQRLQTPRWPGFVSFLTPDQADWRGQQTLLEGTGHAPVSQLTYHPQTGTVVAGDLEPTNDGWLDMGGAPARMTGARHRH